MKILGIETSCDETAMSVIEVRDGNNIKILSNVVSSQVKLHAKYGGVVPALAAREHVKNIKHVFKLAMKEAGIKDVKKEVDLIAVTRGPGLGPALLVGITFARTIAWLSRKPLVGVNHLEGHVYSNWLNDNFKFDSVVFPILNLIVSGGHTELVLMKGHGEYEIIGETLDDAVGEAFDKVARLLGLGYPGGPAIYKAAKNGNPYKYPLPRPMAKSKNYDFSYSGLKTAVLYLIRDLKLKKLNTQTKADIAASFQKAATDILIQKTMRAAKEYKVKSVLLSGGVSANKLLRSELQKNTTEAGIKYFQPPMEYTTDNAAMIAIAGYFTYLKNKKTDYESVKMDANLDV
jgi:N6-L-threonylcarbamoyladenine synthase